MIKRTEQKKVDFSIGIFTQGGTLSDEIGPFDSYEAAAQEMEANTHEMAYSGLCCWHTDKRAAVIENATGKAVFMRHVNDKHGNYIKTEYLNGFAEV